MQIEIRSRHFTLGDEQKEKMTGDLEKLARFSPRPPVSARLTLVNENGRFIGDLAFFLKNTDFRTKVEAAEPELAADEAIENIRTQLSRFKGKLASRQKGEGGGLGRALRAEEPGGAPGDSEPQAEGFRLEDMNLAQARELFEDSEHPFVVFRNTATKRLSVVFRRSNGEFGLLESTDE